MNRMLADYNAIVDDLAANGSLRRLRGVSGGDLLDCTSNDYMGIGADASLRREFFESYSGNFDSLLPGSGASRLLYTSPDDCYGEFETLLGDLYGRDVLLFNSGYHANVGLVSALAIPGTLIVADKLVHASIIDGIRLSGVPFRRFRHNDMDSLERILVRESGNYKRVLLIVESVYSMDGDSAPLREIAALKERFGNLMIYVDEAHAFGVCGERGLGLAEQQGVVDEIDIIVGTLSKAAASVGAFAVVGDVLKSYLVNTARSLIFSTVIPPVSVRWSQFVVNRLVGMGDARRRLADIGREISGYVATLTGSVRKQSSPIVPVMIGGNERTVRAAQTMMDCGVLALPIRHPTVALGSERLRVSLNAALSDCDVEKIKNGICHAVKEAAL